ncbi:MAG: alpha/beta fold hydrolase [Bacteroidia bacterium]
MKSIVYKNPAAKQKIMSLYDQKLASLPVQPQSIYVDTFAGKTHVLKLGADHLPPLVLFHGINAGAAVSLKVIHSLQTQYRLFAIDTIGQATRSAETRLSLKGPDLGRWIAETLDALKIQKACMVGISYGAFLLQKFLQFAPKRVEKAIFVVPSGLVNGAIWPSLRQLSWPLLRFQMTKSKAHLHEFLKAFHQMPIDPFWSELHYHLLTGTHMDYRRPPLLRPSEVAAVVAPVYMIGAENDIFFPAEVAVVQCKACFSNFQEAYLLKESKHIPDPNSYAEIKEKIAYWLQ